ncbi:MAG: DUF4065 domain-containing protein [Chloroflexi bacterium]|nr:DUF4065 domain-containing protein [Chloroflexota bacterium]
MTEQASFTQDMDKFIEAVLYIGERSENDPHFGVSKLTRLLYYSDCAVYMLLGRPITGATYLHFPHGPYPENWYQARMIMEQSGAITVLRDSHAQGYHRYGLLTNRPANREMLAAEEMEEMDAQMERFADYSAAAIEDYSQYEAAWLATEDGQPMSYDLAGWTAPPLSQNSIRHVKEIAKRRAAAGAPADPVGSAGSG